MGNSADGFISVVYTLLNDAIDLLSKTMRDKVLSNDGFNQMMEGATSFDPSSRILGFAINPYSLGYKAGFIVSQVYGTGDLKDVVVPQTVYYPGPERITAGLIGDIIKRQKPKITLQPNSYRDLYNLALSVLINLWLSDFERCGYEIMSKPRRGVYLRDSKGDLYLYEGVQK